jgi:mannitol-1-phosphate 5-dehydrogenase
VSRPRFLQFGAGNIGRGFTGQLFSDAGYDLVFVDVRPEIVAALNERGSYRLRLAGPRLYEEREIGPARAVDGRDMEAVACELAEADLVCTAVGVNTLHHLAPSIALGIRQRTAQGNATPLDVLLCENQLHVGRQFRDQVAAQLPPGEAGLLDQVGFVETVVSRMAPELSPEERAGDLLLAVVEDYDRLPVDAEAFRGAIPLVVGLQPRAPFQAHFERKLFTHNLGHAVAAYLGATAGHRFVHEAITDVRIARIVWDSMDEAGAGLIARWGFTQEEQAAHIAGLRGRFANAALRDTVARVGRDPLRKLRPDDRLVGGGLLALEYGIQPRNIAVGIAAALRFDTPGDPSASELQRRVAESGVERVLNEVCGLEAGHPLARLVLERYS